MNARPQQTEAQRLAGIRASLAAIAPGDWRPGEDEAGGFVEAVGDMGELVVLLRFDRLASEAERAFTAGAPQAMRFLLRLVDRAIAALRPAEGAERTGPAGANADPRKDYAAEAAMKCGEPAFKVFLGERYGLEKSMTDERTAQKLRSLLGVTSRRALNNDDAAAARWKALRGEFEVWRRAER